MCAICARGSVWTVLFDDKTNDVGKVNALIAKIMLSKVVLEPDDSPQYLLSVDQDQ